MVYRYIVSYSLVPAEAQAHQGAAQNIQAGGLRVQGQALKALQGFLHLVEGFGLVHQMIEGRGHRRRLLRRGEAREQIQAPGGLVWHLVQKLLQALDLVVGKKPAQVFAPEAPEFQFFQGVAEIPLALQGHQLPAQEGLVPGLFQVGTQGLSLDGLQTGVDAIEAAELLQ